MSRKPPELLDLIHRMCEGRATVAERDALEARLAEDADARRLYVEHLDLHARLQWRRRGRAQDATFQIADDPTPTLSPFQGRSVWYAAAALVALAVTAWFVLLPEPRTLNPDPAAPRSVAMISDISADAVFTGAARPMQLGLELTPGVIRLEAGRAQVMYHSGAVVDLAGPCEYEMTGPNTGFLHHGTLDALVPQRAAGFNVQAPDDVLVTDLGTRFSMTVGADRASMVRVLTGMVEVRAGGAIHPLVAGQAVAVAEGLVEAVAFQTPPQALAYLPFDQFDMSAAGRRVFQNRTPGQPAAKLVGEGEIVTDCFGSVVPQTGRVNHGALSLRAAGRAPAYVRLDDPIGATLDTAGLTIEAWVRLGAPGMRDRQPVVQCKTVGDPDSRMSFQLMARAGNTNRAPTPEALAFCVGDGETAHFVYSRLAITDDRWHHISAAYDPQRGLVRFTLDDRGDEVEAPRIRPYASRGPVIVGAHSAATGAFDAAFNGQIDELRITRGPLSPEALLNAAPPSTSISHPRDTDTEGDTP